LAEMKLPHLESPAEEAANGITHALGIALSIAALAVLVVSSSSSGDPYRIVACSVFGATLLIMYTASTVYHFVKSPQLKRAMRVFDHASIYLLIAGTYTPIVLVSLRGSWGWSLFGVIWAMAVFGVVTKIYLFDKFELLSVGLYIAMGWIAIVALNPLLAAVPTGGLAWIFSGGIAYTFGVIFFMWDHLPFNHAIWHLFVIGGSVCHFFAVLLYVIPAH